MIYIPYRLVAGIANWANPRRRHKEELGLYLCPHQRGRSILTAFSPFLLSCHIWARIHTDTTYKDMKNLGLSGQPAQSREKWRRAIFRLTHVHLEKLPFKRRVGVYAHTEVSRWSFLLNAVYLVDQRSRLLQV